MCQSPKRKEPTNDDRVVGIEDLRLLFKVERATLRDEMEGEFQSRPAQVGNMLEKSTANYEQWTDEETSKHSRGHHSGQGGGQGQVCDIAEAHELPRNTLNYSWIRY